MLGVSRGGDVGKYLRKIRARECFICNVDPPVAGGEFCERGGKAERAFDRKLKSHTRSHVEGIGEAIGCENDQN